MSERDGKVTREDVETKLRQLSGEVGSQVSEAKPALVTTGVGIAIVLLAIAYLLGRRGGRKRSAVVEIRRV
ncbi:MAG: hypothetical protein ACYCTL_09510 [Acidimicrobiales bacterium]